MQPSSSSLIVVTVTPPNAETQLVGWRAVIHVSGDTDILVRATDVNVNGRTQPMTPVSNALGYGNSMVQRLRLESSSP